MEIMITSREALEARARSPFPPRTAVISITDSDDPDADLLNPPDWLLRLKFDDVHNDLLEEVLGRRPTEEEARILAENFHFITEGQARQIAAFIREAAQPNMADTLICQCEYGQSRSAAVAAAARQYLAGDGIGIWADDRYYPNKLVFRMVTAALD